MSKDLSSAANDFDAVICINENHAIVAWFKKGNADEYRQENSDCI